MKIKVLGLVATVAAAGYDIEMHTADYKAYKELPVCCQYDRNGSRDTCHEGHMH